MLCFSCLLSFASFSSVAHAEEIETDVPVTYLEEVVTDIPVTCSNFVAGVVHMAPNGSGLSPFTVQFSFDTRLLEPNHLYRITMGWGTSQRYFYRASDGAKLTNSNWSSSFSWKRLPSEWGCDIPGVSASLAGSDLYFSFPESALADCVDSPYCNFFVSGYLFAKNYTHKASGQSGALAWNRCSYEVGMTEDDGYLFDTGIVVSGDDSASILEAIKNQTDDINQNHQETMDKIDEQYNTDSSGEINSGVQDAADSAAESMGIVSYADSIIEQFLGLFDASAAGIAQLTLPAFAITTNEGTYEVWDEHVFSFESLEESFSGLLSVVRFATSLLVWGALVLYLQRVWDDVVGGNSA